VLIDEGSLEEVGEMVVRDRKHISEDGILVTIIAINKEYRAIEIDPELVLRGVEFADSERLLAEGKQMVDGHRECVLGRRARRLHGDQGKDPQRPEEVYG
jgi:ribonuclease J